MWTIQQHGLLMAAQPVKEIVNSIHDLCYAQIIPEQYHIRIRGMFSNYNP